MSTAPKTVTSTRVFVDEDTNTGIYEVTSGTRKYRVAIARGGKVSLSLGANPTLTWECTRASLGGGAFSLQDLALIAVIHVESGQLSPRGARTDVRPWPEVN